MSRGIEKEKATELIVLGFLDSFRQALPMEFAVELNQLLKKYLQYETYKLIKEEKQKREEVRREK